MDYFYGMNYEERIRHIETMMPKTPRDKEATVKSTGRNRAERRHKAKKLESKKWFRQKKILALTTAKNGAGLPQDQQLREFYIEFAGRELEGRLKSLSPAFNVLEAFLRFAPKYLTYEIRDERDHLFSIVDFLDFATGSDAPDDPTKSAYSLAENIVYSYNSLGDPYDLTFSIPGFQQFVLGGVSMVRHDDEISLMLLGGPVCSLEEMTTEIDRKLDEGVENFDDAPEKGIFGSGNNLTPEATMAGTEDVWKHIILTRFDLKRKKEQVRYVLAFEGAAYDIATDDPMIFASPPSSGQLKILESNCNFLNKNAILFELSKTALMLPAYFDFKVQLVRETQRRTKFGDAKKLTSPPPQGQKIPRDGRVTFRKVAALEIIDVSTPPSIRTYTPPSFQVEIHGFWRTLKRDSVGHALDGSEVKGRTWVKAHSRWRDRPKPDHVVLVKASVAAAKATVATHEASKRRIAPAKEEPAKDIVPAPSSAKGKKAGYVYVMSNPTMDKDIYKVGRTTKSPDERAKELSAETGVALEFLVVSQWETSDCAAAEKLIHQALEPHRLSKRREFFKAPYKTIHGAINQVLETIP